MIEVLARDSAVLASLALQHGVKLEALRRAVLRDPHGEASGPIGRLLDLVSEPDVPSGQGVTRHQEEHEKTGCDAGDVTS